MDTALVFRASSRARRRRRNVLALAALATIGMAAGQMSLALFTDQETVDATFGSGSIVLDDVKIDALTLTTGAIMPGDSVTDDVVVENDGSGQLRYAMTTSSTNADAKGLRDALTLTVKTIDATTPATPCDNFDGASVLSATVLGATSAGFGNPAAGVQGGERSLNAAASETLCFRVSLPLGTGNAYQSASTTTTFTFDAEQTASNP
ncbi:MAG: SipW-dependent-type signal peptide-containing protein [Chloroflexota bacterium]|nr:SipW-dependent-type signal peptide-containing protein [Chloroflexota bacterium]